MSTEPISEKRDPQVKNLPKCAHPACNCPAQPNSKYCSVYCKDAADKIEISCNCGHQACAAL